MFHMKQRDPILLYVFASFGSAANLARFLGVSRAAICHWKRVPFRHLAIIEEVTGITREQMRPDIYGPKTQP
jgi:DNA-binding transcriptional regulator YdaS (Cro superfamily)